MPNWDRRCTSCGFNGSYLDFDPPTADIKDQECVQCEDGGPVVWEEDDDA